MKRSAPLTRSRMKRVNTKRKSASFARCYGSKERVAWVKSLPCILCDGGPSDNAHVHSRSGMGRKGDYTLIIPLCRSCHRQYDEYRLDAQTCELIAWSAGRIESLWQQLNPSRVMKLA